MKLIAKKPCSFGGKKFYIGDEIPAEYVQNPRSLEKSGVISIVVVATIPVVLHIDGKDYPLNLTSQGLQNVVDVLTTKGEDAKAIVAQMTDEAALILLDATDTRKNIQMAAQARAEALNAPAEPEEAPPADPEEDPTADPEAPEESAGEQ